MKKIYKTLFRHFIVLLFVFPLLSCEEDTTVYRTSYYREDEGRTGRSSESPLNAFHEVEQKINLGNQIYSSMMMDESFLYVNTIDMGYVLSKEDFSTVWKYQKRAVVVSPPITENKTLYVTDVDGGVTAMVKTDGKTVWRMSVEGHVYGSAILWGGLLHIASSCYPDSVKVGSYYQIDMKKGLIKHKIQLPDNVLSSPAASGSTIVFMTHSGILLAYDMQSLSVLWSEDLYPDNPAKNPIDECMAPPVISGGFVYATDPRGIAYAYDLSSGKRIWATNVGAYTDVAPAVYETNMYFGAENGFWCLDTRDGAVRFAFKETGSRVTTGAIIAGSTVYFGTDKGRLIALDTQQGELIWDYQIEYPEDVTMYEDPNSEFEQDPNAPPPAVSLSITADPLLYDKRVLIGSFDYHLYVIN